ncbi:hypothetical protein ACIQC9_12315 [Brevundimonas sp. NPDC092305]|uniref:hypothetical protein n=1 Tax=Brevundimonas sp. NPDC092305 TaxID=3363957 RepID=UPI003822A224
MSTLPINRPVTPAQDLNATVFENVDLSLAELYLAAAQRGPGVVEGRTFRGCRVQGPGIMLVASGTTFEDTNFGDSRGDMANMILRPAGSKVIGAIPMRDCTFIGCEFFGLGFTGAPEILDQLMKLPTGGATT